LVKDKYVAIKIKGKSTKTIKNNIKTISLASKSLFYTSYWQLKDKHFEMVYLFLIFGQKKYLCRCKNGEAGGFKIDLLSAVSF